MTQRRIIQSFYQDLNNVAELLNKTINAYSSLVNTAEALNRNPFASKNDVKDTLDSVEELGDIIDNMIETLDKASGSYLKYVNIKSEAIKAKVNAETICLEIEEELKFKD